MKSVGGEVGACAPGGVQSFTTRRGRAEEATQPQAKGVEVRVRIGVRVRQPQAKGLKVRVRVGARVRVS